MRANVGGRRAGGRGDRRRRGDRIEALLARAGEHAADPQVVLAKDASGQYRIRSANARYLQALQFHGLAPSVDAVRGKTLEELTRLLGVVLEGPALFEERTRQAIDLRRAVRYDVATAGTLPRHVEVTMAPIFDRRHRCTHLVRTIRDVTRRVEADRLVRDSEARLRQAQALARLGSLEFCLATKEVFPSDECRRILEWGPGRPRGGEIPPPSDHPDGADGAAGADLAAGAVGQNQFLELLHEDDRDRVIQVHRAAVASREPYRIVHRLRMRDGRVKWVESRGRIEYDVTGGPVRAVGTIQDITEQILIQQALSEAREAHRQLNAASRLKDRAIAASISAVAFTDLDGTIRYVNASLLRAWRLASDRAIVGCQVLDLFADRTRAATLLGQLRLGHDVIDELGARRPDGSTFTVLLAASVIRDDAGEPVQLMASFVDVSGRVRAEEALRRSDQRYRDLFEQAQDGILLADEDGRCFDFNAGVTALTGYTKTELAGMHLRDLAAPEYRLPLFRVLPAGTSFEREVRWIHKDGRTILIDMRARKLTDGCLLMIVRDVTERRRVEEEARRTRDLLRTVIDCSPDGIFLKDAENRFVLVNQTMAALAGRRPEEMSGRTQRDFFDLEVVSARSHPGLASCEEGDRLALSGEMVQADRVILTGSDGVRRIFSTLKRPLVDDQGQAYGVVGYTQDITDQCEADARQRRSIEEKETLLKEVHHRVKNNLQIVASLLHFQAKQVSDPENRQAFEAVRRRLQAMILVHERLYESHDLTRVEFGQYARSLVAALTAGLSGSARVRLSLNVADFVLPVDLALPSGLILCELLTNVFKYAYPDGEEGWAAVDASACDGAVTLSVRDGGAGFPPGFDPTATATFGWRLVASLARQLNATLTTAGTPGAQVCLSFAVPATAEVSWRTLTTNPA